MVKRQNVIKPEKEVKKKKEEATVKFEFVPEKKGVKSGITWFCETSPITNCKCCKPK